jgi:hypothetical protein
MLGRHLNKKRVVWESCGAGWTFHPQTELARNLENQSSILTTSGPRDVVFAFWTRLNQDGRLASTSQSALSGPARRLSSRRQSLEARAQLVLGPVRGRCTQTRGCSMPRL